VELISRVSTRIDLLARESNILSLNARIEAARAGAQGSAFQVVAGEMNRLSQQVAKANAEVLDLAERLGELLPAVASSALLARRETERLGETTVRQGLAAQHALGELQADVGKAIADSERSVDDVLRLSQAALSHLQFQDVVSQSLRSIDAVIHGVAVDALDALGPDLGSTSVSPPAYTTLGLFMDDSAESNGLANGEVILF
jgi:methyl-accepting chemotaxis protein